MTAEHLVEHGNGPQAGGGPQHGDDLGVPDPRQRVQAASDAGDLALGGQTGIGIKPGAGAGADARPGRGELAGVGLTMVHVQSRLLVGDVRAGHEAVPRGENRHSGTNLTPPQAGPRRKEPTLPGLTYGRATPRLRSAPAITIQIDARNHPDCRYTDACVSSQSLPCCHRSLTSGGTLLGVQVNGRRHDVSRNHVRSLWSRAGSCPGCNEKQKCQDGGHLGPQKYQHIRRDTEWRARRKSSPQGG